MFVLVRSGLSWSERRFPSLTDVNRSFSSSSVGFPLHLAGEKSYSCLNKSLSSSADGSVSSRRLMPDGSFSLACWVCCAVFFFVCRMAAGCVLCSSLGVVGVPR